MFVNQMNITNQPHLTFIDTPILQITCIIAFEIEASD